RRPDVVRAPGRLERGGGAHGDVPRESARADGADSGGAPRGAFPEGRVDFHGGLLQVRIRGSARPGGGCRVRRASPFRGSRGRVRAHALHGRRPAPLSASEGAAYRALVPTLVDREDPPNAVALNSIQFTLARVIGPVLAGAAFATLG